MPLLNQKSLNIFSDCINNSCLAFCPGAEHDDAEGTKKAEARVSYLAKTPKS